MLRFKTIAPSPFLLMALSTLLMNCRGKPTERYEPIPIVSTNRSGAHFVGSKQCTVCHSDIVQSHRKTAHFNSSARAEGPAVLGSTSKGKNIYHLNDSIFFKIQQDDSLFYQEIWTARLNSPLYRSKLDIVIGSGTKGQSYLSWKGNGLFQQQISYHSPTDSWINSPMFPKQKVVRPRPVLPKCIGCHSTYARTLSNKPTTNLYAKSMVLGIDCERCHGPAYKHVVNQTYMQGTANDGIVSFGNMSRQQRLDACALCHSGIGVKVDNNNIMEYTIGEPLPIQNTSTSGEDLDVHGNQYGLLVQSQCFKKSKSMDCTSCHNVHKDQRNDTTYFNNICISCHDLESLNTNAHSTKTNNRCTSCHMPLQNSEQLLIGNQRNDSLEPLKVRSHLIAVYGSNVSKSKNQ